ncbi:molybdopterin-dependent oxidoreductase [Halomonas sp. NO4]|uniref:molybdopterin-dependent oxidoreductase n=1 Tax=Halomonas sp. NO4 TaxID=2484813 RepID=UPI0013D7DA0E|nr:molybdopterin-dependent oxidoreductase [Halomonas sp. NO4]
MFRDPLQRFLSTLGVTLLCVLSLTALADALPPPEGEVLLRVEGDIAHPNVGDELHLDRTQLMALPTRVIETRIPWTQGVFRFEGPLLRAVLAEAGAEAQHVRVRALNDYEAEIPVSDLHDYDVILALERDGEPIAVRDFGPMLVLYPFDDHPELLTESIRFRSVWHVARIHVP